MTFDGTQKNIGTGAQAEVLLYHGFAYKVYKPSYPAEWISFEKAQQTAVNKAGLCPVKYYDTDDSHIIKMDLVDGITLEKRMNERTAGTAPTPDVPLVKSPEEGFALIAEAFRFVHKADADGVSIPHLRETAAMGMNQEEASKVLSIIERLSAKHPSCICHLDMHFLNIMLLRNKEEYVLIDWMNTRLAPAVFDYARTYVIFFEFAKEVAPIYKQLVWPDIQALGFSDEDFDAAVEACTIIRAQEKN